jgi:hypothetical protein
MIGIAAANIAAGFFQGFPDNYRSSLPRDLQVLFDRYVLRDVAVKVVGVGSVGTGYAVLFTDDDGAPTPTRVLPPRSPVILATATRSTSPSGSSGSPTRSRPSEITRRSSRDRLGTC